MENFTTDLYLLLDAVNHGKNMEVRYVIGRHQLTNGSTDINTLCVYNCDRVIWSMWDTFEPTAEYIKQLLNSERFEFREKEPFKYAPFTDPIEFFEEAQKHNFWVKLPTRKHAYKQITAVSGDSAYTGTIAMRFSDLCISNYVWADDGSPIGKKVK